MLNALVEPIPILFLTIDRIFAMKPFEHSDKFRKCTHKFCQFYLIYEIIF